MAGYGLRRSVLIGSPSGREGFERHLAIQRYRGYDILAIIPAVPNVPESDDGDLTSVKPRKPDNWRAIVSDVGADVVIVNLGEWAGSSQMVLDIVSGCSELGVEVEVCSSLFHTNSVEFEIDNCSGCLRLRPHSRWAVQAQRVMKTVFDVLIGSVGSVITLMILPVIWALIKLEDGGPLFYHSEYLGCDGELHYYLKFRTMIRDADVVLQNDPELKQRFEEKQKLRNDPRTLRIGRVLRKYSIDEFPQFFNILTSQLTFVGPRTIRLSEAKRYGPYLAKRLSVKPGLTGYWQVMGRQMTTYEERVLMDMFYIDHWSIWLDVVIIAKTIGMFFSQKGAY
jgi:lipopolysaccharide/colanic/teichoic acid biosynthesis glycosyltransferase